MQRALRSSVVTLSILVLLTAEVAASHYPVGAVLPSDVAQKLGKAGIKTTADLLDKAGKPRPRAKLAKSIGVAAGRLKSWASMCDLLRIKGVGPQMTKLFGTVKITTVAQLRRHQAKSLYLRLLKANDKAKVTENPPSEQHLGDWIRQAKKLKLVLR